MVMAVWHKFFGLSEAEVRERGEEEERLREERAAHRRIMEADMRRRQNALDEKGVQGVDDEMTFAEFQESVRRRAEQLKDEHMRKRFQERRGN